METNSINKEEPCSINLSNLALEIQENIAEIASKKRADVKQKCGEIKFDSYDRLFPSQDFLQKDGCGNLIALPLQKEARVKNNSVFVDEKFNEFKDQWAYLSQIQKLSEEFVLNFIKTHKVNEGDKENKLIERMNNKEEIQAQKIDFPEKIIMNRCSGMTICKEGISPKGLFALRKMASYLNPEFYSKQAMRQSTYKIQRITVIQISNNRFRFMIVDR
jgi:hypothetical protein